MSFFSVGTDYLSPELFQNIKNSPGKKPTGGLWATRQNEKYPNQNSWVDFILCNHQKYMLFIKYGYDESDNFKIPAVSIILKPDASILTIETDEQLNYILRMFPDGNGWIDHEKLAQEFDGIYIDPFSLLRKNIFQGPLESYGVGSLILFNLKCIKEYKKAVVIINANYETPFDPFTYNIEFEGVPEFIMEPNQTLLNLISLIKSYIKSHDYNYTTETESIILSLFSGKLDEAFSSFDKPKQMTLKRLLIHKSFESI